MNPTAIPQGYWTEGKMVNGTNTGGGQFVQGTPPPQQVQPINPSSTPVPPPVINGVPSAQTTYVGSQRIPEYLQNQQISQTSQPSNPQAVNPAVTQPNVSPFEEKKTSAQSGIDASTQNIQAATQRFNIITDQFNAGTVPLNAYQQDQVNATKDSFNAIIEAQKLANKNFEGGTSVAQEARGLSRYSPEIAMGNILAAVTEGNKKVADLNSKMNLSVSQMTQAFQESNYKQVKDAYETLVSAEKDRTTALEKVRDYTQKQEDVVIEQAQNQVIAGVNSIMYDETISLNDRKQKAAQLISAGHLTGAQIKVVQDQMRQIEQEDIKSKLESDKFSWQQKTDIAKNAIDQGHLSIDEARLALDRQKLALDAKAPGSASSLAAEAKSDLTNNLNLVTSILDDPYLQNVTGAKLTSWYLPSPGAVKIPFTDKTFGSLYGSKTVAVSNKIKQLTSALSIENRQKLKGSGAISDFEARTLEKAASSFSTGLSDVDAIKQLHQIQGVMRTASGLTSPVKVKDIKTGEFNIVNLGRDAIDEAVRQGFLVEYQ